MPFRFKKSESPARAVARVGGECVHAARECLRDREFHAAIHGVRKEVKKLRAMLRLVRAGIARDEYRKMVKVLRQTARRLAPPRDAWVAVKSFENLAGASGPRFFALEKNLRKSRQHQARRFWKQDSATATERRLRKIGRRLAHLKVQLAGWTTVEPVLEAGWRHGRDVFELVRRKPSPAKLHAWRKAAKSLWYQLQLLQPAEPAARARIKQLELLGGLLGEHHDLVLLQETSTKEADEAAPLNRLIEARQKKLRAEAVKLGARIFARTPAAGRK